MGTDYLSVNQAAEFLGVHPQTIRNWYRNGILKYSRPNNHGKIFIKKTSLEKVMEMNNENKDG